MRSASISLNGLRLGARRKPTAIAGLVAFPSSGASGSAADRAALSVPSRRQAPGLDALVPTPYGPRLARRV